MELWRIYYIYPFNTNASNLNNLTVQQLFLEVQLVKPAVIIHVVAVVGVVAVGIIAAHLRIKPVNSVLEQRL